jgi:hypothetical protein
MQNESFLKKSKTTKAVSKQLGDGKHIIRFLSSDLLPKSIRSSFTKFG